MKYLHTLAAFFVLFTGISAQTNEFKPKSLEDLKQIIGDNKQVILSYDEFKDTTTVKSVYEVKYGIPSAFSIFAVLPGKGFNMRPPVVFMYATNGICKDSELIFLADDNRLRIPAGKCTNNVAAYVLTPQNLSLLNAAENVRYSINGNPQTASSDLRNMLIIFEKIGE